MNKRPRPGRRCPGWREKEGQAGSALAAAGPEPIVSDGTHVWVANISGNSVTELSARTGRLVKVI